MPCADGAQDAQNHYSHGSLHPVYFGVCFAIYLLIILQFTIYGRFYPRQNRSSLYAVMLLVIAGIGMQEMFPGVRTAYLGMTIDAGLMFIHYSEFSQLKADSYIEKQQLALQTDPLTGLLNRYAYSQFLKDYAANGALPEDFVAYTIDINGLKHVNDTLGHEAGDELIKGVAECIGQVFGTDASCYRTGGDEFVILATGPDCGDADAMLSRLERETGKWRGSRGQELRLAAGYALAKDDRSVTVEELVRKSDLAMYLAKAEYYGKAGHDRRKRR